VKIEDHLGPYGHTPLTLAAQRGNTTVIQSLVAAGARINYETRSSLTALQYATLHQHFSAVQVLLEAKADPEFTSHPRVDSARKTAEKAGNMDILALFAARRFAAMRPPLPPLRAPSAEESKEMKRTDSSSSSSSKDYAAAAVDEPLKKESVRSPTKRMLVDREENVDKKLRTVPGLFSLPLPLEGSSSSSSSSSNPTPSASSST